MSEKTEEHSPGKDQSVSRRTFLQQAGTATAAGLAVAPAVWAGAGKNADTLRVGLIGCGSRGSGAAVNAMQADRIHSSWRWLMFLKTSSKRVRIALKKRLVTSTPLIRRSGNSSASMPVKVVTDRRRCRAADHASAFSPCPSETGNRSWQTCLRRKTSGGRCSGCAFGDGNLSPGTAETAVNHVRLNASLQ